MPLTIRLNDKVIVKTAMKILSFPEASLFVADNQEGKEIKNETGGPKSGKKSSGGARSYRTDRQTRMQEDRHKTRQMSKTTPPAQGGSSIKPKTL